MARDTLIDEIHDRKDVKRTFEEIRAALEKATSREDLTELYKQAVYMILMTHASPVKENDSVIKRRRESTESEFARTVGLINQKAKRIGAEPDFNEDWEKISTNGYETEDDNLLEAQDEVGIIKE